MPARPSIAGSTLAASAAALSLGLAAFSEAATLTVATNADSGAGSIRQAILDSNASAGTLDTGRALVRGFQPARGREAP